jgi:hypothetical protein
MTKIINIIAPIGGYGNHVRWLVSLDPTFTLNLTPPSLENFVLTNVEEKINFIQDRIYFPERSWHNWLEVEWRYREGMHNSIPFGHSYVELRNTEPTLILTIEPELAYRSYLKFNSNLNNRSRDRFFRDIVEENTNNIQFAHSDSTVNYTTVLSSDILFQPMLDKEFYNKLISFFGLQDQYEQANHIHQLWYCCHRQAEQEFVHDIAQVYK